MSPTIPAIRITIALVSLLLASCATREPRMEMGSDADVTFDGLHRVNDTRFQRVWAKPGIDLSLYKRILLLDSGIHYKRSKDPQRNRFELSESEIEQLRSDLHAAFQRGLQDNDAWEVVTERGPEVLSLRVALIDLVVSAPPRQDSARDRNFVQTAAEATLIVELHDSQSKEILARVAERRAATGDSLAGSLNTPATNRAAMQRVFRDWAGRLRLALNNAKTIQLPSE